MKTTQLFLFALALTSTSVYADENSNTAPPVPTDSTSPTNSYYSAPPEVPPTPTKKKKKKKSSAEAPTGVQELTLPMSKGQLEAEVDADVAQRERANAPRTMVELDVSSWKPNSVSTPSVIPNTTNFTTKGFPALDLDLFSPLMGHELALETGLGFLTLQRTGTLVSSGIYIPQSQTGYITMLRLGVTYSPWRFMEDKLVPYGEALLLPTLFLSKSTTFDGGDSQIGIPFSIGAGALYRFTKSFAVDLGLTEVLGSVQGSSYTGFGVHGGIRIRI